MEGRRSRSPRSSRACSKKIRPRDSRRCATRSHAGDAAFGTRVGHSRFRPSIASIFFAAYGAAALALFGYPRATTFAEWFRGAGWGIFVTFATFFDRRRVDHFSRERARVRPRSSSPRRERSARRPVSQTSSSDRRDASRKRVHALSRRRVGSASEPLRRIHARVGAAFTPPRFVARRRRTQRSALASMVSLALACVAVTLGYPSAAIVIAALAFVFVLPPTLATLAGLACAALAAITRAQALCDAAWSLEPTRAARAVALASAIPRAHVHVVRRPRSRSVSSSPSRRASRTSRIPRRLARVRRSCSRCRTPRSPRA